MSRGTGPSVLLFGLDAYSNAGGIQTYIRRTVASLRASCIEVTGVLLWDDAADVPGEGIRGCGRRKLRFMVYAVAALLRNRADIVILGHVLLWPLGLLARVLRPRARLVLLAYGDEIWSPPPAARRAAVAASVHRVIAVSRHTMRRAGDVYGLPLERFAVLEPAVDAATRSPDHRSVARTAVITVSRLADRYKGIDKLIRAFPAVRAAVPDATLVVVGEGALRGELESLATSLGLEGIVRFTGLLGDEALDAAYREAAVFAMPSTEEGYGIVFLEAWARGLPVVAAERGAAAEVVEHGRTGLLVDPDDPPAITRAIIELLDDPAWSASLGASGRARVLATNTPEAFRQRLAAIVTGAARHAGTVPATESSP